MSADATAPQARLVRVRGLVQGVGFRYGVQRRAEAEGAAGWVRNRRDGSVEALLVGDAAALDALCAWLKRGVPGARVDAVEVRAADPPESPAGFVIAPTA